MRRTSQCRPNNSSVGSAILLTATLCGLAAGGTPGGCASCHRAESTDFERGAMPRALESAAQCSILIANPKLTAQIGFYSYEIERAGEQSIYTVTDNGHTIRVPLAWAFGQGAAGQTYLFERNGQWYESRVSYFSAVNGLDLTMGAKDIPVRNIDDAAGRLIGPTEVAQCFNCHATHATANHQLTLVAMTGGVRCERCHGDAAGHLAAVRKGDAANFAMRKLGGMRAEEMANFCGQCHRTWSQIAMSGPFGVLNVRFQPYRLSNSPCFDTSDPRIRCTACHDPHGELRTEPASYDASCKACHAAGAQPATRASTHICRVSTKNCVSCHMPRVELPGSHKRFTDHEIRIAKANDKYRD